MIVALGTAFKKHWPALVLAFLFGLMLILPAVAAHLRFNVAFDSPANIRAADEFLYLARIREVLDGHPTIGNAYLWEYKAKPPSPLFLGEWLLAQPVFAFQKLSGQAQPQVVAADVLYDFFLPAIAFLLTYACLMAVTSQRGVALFGAAFLFFGLFPGDFARAWSPQLVFPFWLSQFLLTFLVIRDAPPSPQVRYLPWLAAANFGLLFYLYPYYWTFYLAFFAIAAFLFFLRGERPAAKLFGIIAAGGLVLAIPYIVMTVRAAALPEYVETLRRIGMIDSHFPSGLAIVVPAVLLLAVCALAIRLRIISWNRPTIFFVSGVLAAAASVNQHVITGKNLEFSSHYSMLAAFWFVFFAAYLLGSLGEWVSRRPGMRAPAMILGRWPAVSAAAAVFAVIVFGFRAGPAWFRGSPPEALAMERYGPVLDWVNRNTAPDDVIYAPPELSELIPIYTGANVYFASPARVFFVPDAEVLDRFILSRYYDTFEREFVAENFRSVFGNAAVNAALHAGRENAVRRLLGLELMPVDAVPDAAVERIENRYRELRQGDFERELKRYRVDYLVWDRSVLPDAPFDRLPFLAKRHEEGTFTIYQVY